MGCVPFLHPCFRFLPNLCLCHVHFVQHKTSGFPSVWYFNLLRFTPPAGEPAVATFREPVSAGCCVSKRSGPIVFLAVFHILPLRCLVSFPLNGSFFLPLFSLFSCSTTPTPSLSCWAHLALTRTRWIWISSRWFHTPSVSQR